MRRRRRPDLWIMAETIQRDGTTGPTLIRNTPPDATLVIEVSRGTAILTITNVDTGQILAAIAPKPGHPAQTSTTHRFHLEPAE